MIDCCTALAGTISIKEQAQVSQNRGTSYLTSTKLEGILAVMLPPKRSVFVNSGAMIRQEILGNQDWISRSRDFITLYLPKHH